MKYKIDDTNESNKSNGNTQALLALMYATGNGRLKDYQKAFELNQLAAEQGNAVAQVNLGIMYESGLGVAKDPVKAIELFHLAAQQGNHTAQSKLGHFYSKDMKETQDLVKALKYYELAAQQGNAIAQCSLGVMYANGQGVTKNYKHALTYYQLAAAQEYPLALTNLGIMYANGQGVVRNQEKAFEYFQKGAIRGQFFAHKKLGMMYKTGTGVQQDIIKAWEHFDSAEKLEAAKNPAEMDAVMQEINKKAFSNLISLFRHSVFEKITQKLRQAPKKYEKLYAAASEFVEALETSSTLFFQKSNPTLKDLALFESSCQSALTNAKLVFEEHRGFGNFPYFIKLLLGVLAAITIIPAIVVHNTTTEGYKATFFGTTKTKSEQELEHFAKYLQNKTTEIETYHNKPRFSG